MRDASYKKFTESAKRSIRGESFFESLVCEYAIPHKVVGAKDVGVDYICEWVYGDRPSGIMFAVQVKTVAAKRIKLKSQDIDTKLNLLERYEIGNWPSSLQPDERTFRYWRGLGLPFYLFLIVDGTGVSGSEEMQCY